MCLCRRLCLCLSNVDNKFDNQTNQPTPQNKLFKYRNTQTFIVCAYAIFLSRCSCVRARTQTTAGSQRICTVVQLLCSRLLL